MPLPKSGPEEAGADGAGAGVEEDATGAGDEEGGGAEDGDGATLDGAGEGAAVLEGGGGGDADVDVEVARVVGVEGAATEGVDVVVGTGVVEIVDDEDDDEEVVVGAGAFSRTVAVETGFPLPST